MGSRKAVREQLEMLGHEVYGILHEPGATSRNMNAIQNIMSDSLDIDLNSNTVPTSTFVLHCIILKYIGNCLVMKSLVLYFSFLQNGSDLYIS